MEDGASPFQSVRALRELRYPTDRNAMNEASLKHRDGVVQVLPVSNPAARNALIDELYAAIRAALSEAQADSGIGAIVLTGVGEN